MVGCLLVVNDEPKAGRALKGALATEGFEVILAADDGEAVAVAQDAQPDAVIVDLVASNGRAATVCRRMRESSPQLPVLMLGSGDTVVERSGALAAGANDYLAKPFVLIELLTRIRGLLRRSDVGLRLRIELELAQCPPRASAAQARSRWRPAPHSHGARCRLRDAGAVGPANRSLIVMLPLAGILTVRWTREMMRAAGLQGAARM